MTQWNLDAMHRRLVRYADLQPCRAAFIEAQDPASTGNENFTIIGTGLSENAHIREPHGFNIRAARQSAGCVNPQHSFDAAEVFVVHSGHWRLHFGPDKEDGSLDIAPGDVASVPSQIFRGISKLDEGKGFLWIPMGQDDPGKAQWTPAVFEAAADHGLRLAKAGRVVDTTSGNYELKNLEWDQAWNGVTLADKLAECVVRADAIVGNHDSLLAGKGIEEAGVIVPRATNDRFPAGPICGWWKHGLNLRRLTLQTAAYVPMHARSEAEVLFVQSGTVEVSWGEGALLMGAGDTLSVPVGLQHAFRNTASVPAVLFVVRGTEDPAMPVFASKPWAE